MLSIEPAGEQVSESEDPHGNKKQDRITARASYGIAPPGRRRLLVRLGDDRPRLGRFGGHQQFQGRHERRRELGHEQLEQLGRKLDDQQLRQSWREHGDQQWQSGRERVDRRQINRRRHNRYRRYQ